MNSLAKFAQDKRETWDENVGEVVHAQMKQKLHYDRKHGAGDLYTVGSQVLKISEGRRVNVANWTTFG